VTSAWSQTIGVDRPFSVREDKDVKIAMVTVLIADTTFACPKAFGLNTVIQRDWRAMGCCWCACSVVAAVPRSGRGWKARGLSGRVGKAVEVNVSDPGEGDSSLSFTTVNATIPCVVLPG
jgi:hypothetical protein